MMSRLRGGSCCAACSTTTAGCATAVASAAAISIIRTARIPRQGNNPARVSASIFGGDLRSAGRIEETNSSHGDDHSTSNCGTSATLPSDCGRKVVIQLNQRRSQCNEDQRGEDKHDQGDDHLDGCLGCLFFSSLPP